MKMPAILADVAFGYLLITIAGVSFLAGVFATEATYRLRAKADNDALTKARKKAAADILPTIASRRDAWASMADEITEAVEMAEWSRHG